MRKSSSVYLVFFILSLTLFVPKAFSEDAERGRLADGRAYRTDVEGNQIIDYVAELELENMALRRRIGGLETEVEARDAELSRQTSDTVAGVVERDITGPSAPPAPAVAFQQRDCSIEVRNARMKFQDQEQDYLHQVQELRSTKSKISEHSARLQALLDQREVELEGLRTRYQQVSNTLQQKLDDAERARLVALDRASQEAEESRIAQLRLEEQGRQASIAEGRAREYQRKLEALRAQNAKEQKEHDVVPIQTIPSRASLNENRLRRPVRDTSPVRDAAVESLRGSVRRELTSVSRLMQKRDTLFEQYRTRHSSGAVVISPQRATSARGKSLSQVKALVAGAQSIHELARLQADIRQIEEKLREDLAALDRMAKISS